MNKKYVWRIALAIQIIIPAFLGAADIPEELFAADSFEGQIVQAVKAGENPVSFIAQGKIQFVQELINRTIIPLNKAISIEGSTPLMIAAGYGQDAIVSMLLGMGAQIDLQDKQGQTALRYAINEKKDSVIPLLLDAGASVTLNDRMGYSPLIAALETPKVSLDTFKLLVNRMPDINAFFSEGVTILGLAIANGATHKALFLIQQGADIHRLNKSSMNWLTGVLAERFDKPIFTELDIIRIGKQILSTHKTISPKEVEELLGYSLIKKSLLVLRWVVTLPDCPLNRSIDHWIQSFPVPAGKKVLPKKQSMLFTPLIYAALMGERTIAEILLKAGADPTIHAYKGKFNAADLAVREGHYALAHILGSSLSPRELLIRAIKGNELDDVRYFIEELTDSPPSPNDADQEGVTPLMVAIVEGHEDSIRFLLEHGGDLKSTTVRGWSAETLVKQQKKLSRSFKEYAAQIAHSEECAATLCSQEEQALAHRIDRLSLKKERAKQAQVQRLLARGSDEQGGAAAAQEESSDESDRESDGDPDDDVDARYLELYTKQLRARESSTDAAAHPKKHHSRKKLTVGTTQRIKPFVVQQSIYADRVKRWFKNPRQILLSPEYAGTPEPFFDDIIFRHALMPLLDRYTRDWAIFDAMPQRGSVLARMLCVVIRGNSIEKGVLEYVVDENNILFHRYFNLLSKHPDIEARFNAIPLNMQAHTLNEEELISTEPFIATMTNTYMQLYDPQEEITLFVIKPLRP